VRVERLGQDVRINPGGPVHGVCRPPGSKSLTNRHLTCAALADWDTILEGASCSDDTKRMIAGLEALGVPVHASDDGRQLEVRGCRGNLPATGAEIDVGHAGTALRFLTALAALGYGRFRLDGSARLRQRPIGPLVGALQSLGAGIGYEATPGCPPLTIEARGLAGGRVRVTDPESSQFISALLMVAPYAAHDVYLTIEGPLPSQPYVAMTTDVMHALGVEVLSAESRRYVVAAGQRYRAGTFAIEPDASAATYFWAAAAVTGGRVLVQGLDRDSRQGDVGFIDVLAQMGCTVHEEAGGLAVAGPAPGELHGIDVDLNAMPDTVQTLAVVALFARGPTTVRRVGNLRVKETDRLAALTEELSRLGARVEQQDDGLTIHPPATITPAAVATYDDHRMAMSFAVAGLAAGGITIRDADCVTKSLPGFFEALAGL
jgi:3-phosphoshikimate 1-carboxyvinyltransferase